MWTSLTVVAALAMAPAQPSAAGGLTLSNVRLTYGELGGTRPETKLLPGDILWIGFDIDGLTINQDGRTTYLLSSEFLDSKGKVFRKEEPAEMVDFVPLGGTRIPARAYILAGQDQPAGTYTMKLTVADKASKASKTLEYKFEVTEPGFGIVAVSTSADPDGRFSAPNVGVVGQLLFVQFNVVGFQRNNDKKQPVVAVEMQPLDAAGKPTLAKPEGMTIDNGVDEKVPSFLLRFPLPLTRLGKYTVRLKATDKVSNKTATFDLPIAVVPSAN